MSLKAGSSLSSFANLIFWCIFLLHVLTSIQYSTSTVKPLPATLVALLKRYSCVIFTYHSILKIFRRPSTLVVWHMEEIFSWSIAQRIAWRGIVCPLIFLRRVKYRYAFHFCFSCTAIRFYPSSITLFADLFLGDGIC